MADETNRIKGSGVKRLKRLVFLVGIIVAAIPILCQVLMLAAIAAAPDAFPAADRTFTEARFWPIQVVLLCVAVAGSAFVNCVRVNAEGAADPKMAPSPGFAVAAVLFR